MAELRHSLVAELATGRNLLDVACGTGYALPQIADHARSVTGCDINEANLRDAQSHLSQGRFCLSDAERLPFRDGSFGAVVCLEAVYYLQDWIGFLDETHRVLDRAGRLLITWPNPGRPAFDRSPNSVSYPTSVAMTEAAAAAGFSGRCYGAFPIDRLSTAQRPLLGFLRANVVRLHLIPKSLRLRMLLKRILYRRMKPLSQMNLMPAPLSRLTEVDDRTANDFTMLYYIGERNR